jgi:hypothetical protein
VLASAALVLEEENEQCEGKEKKDSGERESKRSYEIRRRLRLRLRLVWLRSTESPLVLIRNVMQSMSGGERRNDWQLTVALIASALEFD